MKDWQFFCLLATIYAAPHINKRWSGVVSAAFTVIAFIGYYWG